MPLLAYRFSNIHRKNMPEEDRLKKEQKYEMRN